MEIKSRSLQNLKEIQEPVNYYPGKLTVIMNEYFNNQKNNDKTTKNISYWEYYVSNYFNTNINYYLIMNQEGTQWVFKSGYEILPLIFLEKYSDNTSLISVSLDGANEFILNSSKEEGIKYMLKVNDLSKIEKYGDFFVMTNGILTVIFDKNLKILKYEFQSLSHKIMNNNYNDTTSLNDFGITPQFSRTLVISEVLTEMNESINEFVNKFNNN